MYLVVVVVDMVLSVVVQGGGGLACGPGSGPGQGHTWQGVAGGAHLWPWLSRELEQQVEGADCVGVTYVYVGRLSANGLGYGVRSQAASGLRLACTGAG